MRYLVTGGAGFIGSALVHALVARGDEVRVLDNLSTGFRHNLADVINDIDFHEADLRDTHAVGRACKGIDYVLHQGAVASVPRSVADPVGTHESNVTGTLNLLIAARDAGVRRLVFASSSSIYGESPTLPKHEGMVPEPISPYAVSKLAGEAYLAAFHRVYGLETVALRYFNIFGPRQDPSSQYSGVMAKFISVMLADEAPVVFGDGEQSRDFTYVDNAVAANLLACTAPASAVGRAFNVATGTRITLNDLLRELKGLTGCEAAPRYTEERSGDIKHSLADVSAARAALGYEVSVNFAEGLRRTVEWYRKSSARGSGVGSTS